MYPRVTYVQSLRRNSMALFDVLVAYRLESMCL